MCFKRWQNNIAILCLCLLISSCASYSSRMADVRKRLHENDPQSAFTLLKKIIPSSNDLLLKELDFAILLRQLGRFKESNKHFENAKKIAASLEATSVSDQFQAITINDEKIEYQGQNYELLFIHGFSALNYLDLALLDEARVEILQAQEKIKKWQKSEKETGGYLWVQYLAGVIYEKLGELDNATISYRYVVEGFKKINKPIPDFLKYDFLNLLYKVELTDEYHKWLEWFDLEGDGLKKEQSELIVIFFNGLAPQKKTYFLPRFSNDIGKDINIALPYYPLSKQFIHHANILVSTLNHSTQQFESVDLLARQSLNNDMPKIISRALLRKSFKRSLVEESEKKDNKSLGFFSRIASIATEHADTRNWNTLPNSIQISRFALMPGKYKVLAEFIDYNGYMRGTQELSEIEIKKNEKKVFSFHFVFQKLF